MFPTALALIFFVKQFLMTNFYGFVIIFAIFELKSKTLQNILNTLAFKNYGKFANHNLQKLCLWS